jgi:hypothetical protein
VYSLITTLKRVFNDVVAGKHLDAYAVTLVAFTLAVLGILEDSLSINVKLAAILAALGLLVFKTTTPDERKIDLDNVLRDRQSYGSFRNFIRGGKVVWVYGASNVNVLRQAADIKTEILDRGGEVRFLIQDPENSASMEILRQQLDPIHSLDDDIRTSLLTLKNMTGWKTRGTIDYALAPYSPGFSMLIVDPDGREGRLVIEFYGFRNELITERMHIEVHRSQSNYWFEFWASQFVAMWEAARKPETIGER